MSDPSTGATDGAPWELQSVQLNLFPVDFAKALSAEQNWVEAITGESPESNRKKLERVDKVEVKGPAGTERVIQLTIGAGKINWLEIAPPVLNPEEPIDRVPTLGAYAAVRDRFMSMMTGWLPSCPLVWRVGFGAFLARPATSHAHAYQQLQDYLPFLQLDPEGSSDLIYRINRRRDSKIVPGLPLNRLVKWAALKIEFGASVEVPGAPPTQFGESIVWASTAELDINSSPAHSGPLDATILPALIGELVSLGTEIACRGDHK